MKLHEFITKLEQRAFMIQGTLEELEKQRQGDVLITKGKQDIALVSLCKENTYQIKKLKNMDIDDALYVLNQINKFVKTPVEQRFREPIFTIKIKGLSEGRNYLQQCTCSNKQYKKGSIFLGGFNLGADLSNNYYRKVFTMQELEQLLKKNEDLYLLVVNSGEIEQVGVK